MNATHHPSHDRKSSRIVVATAFALLPIIAMNNAQACATCGCSLSTDAAMGYTSATGFRVSLQYDFINQNQLRSGTSSISPSQVAAINDAGGNQEVEKQTINRYTTLGLSYSSSPDWNYKLMVPYISRSHTTYGASPNPLTSDNISGANVNSLGDMRFIVSYQGLLPTHNLGIQLGVKLPTGDYGGQNVNTGAIVGRNPVYFGSGNSAGQLLDTSLNAGTGSTDLVVGGYYYQPVSQDYDAFISGQFQAAVKENLNQSGEDYRPGNQENISFGVRYEANPKIVPQLQANITHKSTDQGALADTKDSAGTVLYLSPGVSATVLNSMQAYAFIQVPLYSNLDGYQLFPHWTATVGIAHAF